MSAPTTPARCEPPPELRGVDGRHWLNGGGEDFPADWNAHFRGWWAVEHHLRGHSTQETAAMGYRYLAPVAPPAEVDALRADEREKCAKVADAYANESLTAKSIAAAIRARVET